MSDTVTPADYKVYWFSRDLVKSDYGGYATSEKEQLVHIADELKLRLEQGDSLDDLREFVRESIPDPVSETYGGDISKRYRQTEDLAERTVRRIEEKDDLFELILAARSVVRVSEILDGAPSFGEDEIHQIVEQTLEDDGSLDPSKAYDALFEVDVEGEAYQLGGQRALLVEYVDELLERLEREHELDSSEIARIVSSVVQEYERRAGNSRASTAGNVLETGLDYIFDRFDVPSTGSPEHFGDLEIDNLVTGPDAKIGFSCKRTLRERFRQSLLREVDVDLDEIWFVSLLMADVSKEKLEDIANDGGRIYVPRDSFVWENYGDEPELSYHLRPADEFIADVFEFTGIELDPNTSD